MCILGDSRQNIVHAQYCISSKRVVRFIGSVICLRQIVATAIILLSSDDVVLPQSYRSVNGWAIRQIVFDIHDI